MRARRREPPACCWWSAARSGWRRGTVPCRPRRSCAPSATARRSTSRGDTAWPATPWTTWASRAVDAVHQVGEPVALVVAESKTEAEAAAELIAVSYADLPAVAHQVPALAEGAPQLWAEAPGNLCLDYELGNRAAVEEAFAK